MSFPRISIDSKPMAACSARRTIPKQFICCSAFFQSTGKEQHRCQLLNGSKGEVFEDEVRRPAGFDAQCVKFAHLHPSSLSAHFGADWPGLSCRKARWLNFALAGPLTDADMRRTSQATSTAMFNSNFILLSHPSFGLIRVFCPRISVKFSHF